MRVASRREAKAIDLAAQNNAEFALSGEVLMEAAGALAAQEILQSFPSELRHGTVSIVCGPGNNGADGLVCARHLASQRKKVRVFLIAPEKQRSPLCNLQLSRLSKIESIQFIDLEQAPSQKNDLVNSSLIVDAIFGIGLDRELQEPFVSVINAINQFVTIVSLDTPSGLNVDTGIEMGAAVRAQMTITFGLAKRGFFVADGPGCVGRIRVLPIGYPPALLLREAQSNFAITGEIASGLLPRRAAKANKSDHGRVAIIAGSSGMWGAAMLAATSAARIGAGYVYWAHSASPNATALAQAIVQQPDLLTLDIDATDFWEKRKWQVAVVGPGLGVTEHTDSVLKNLLKQRLERVVIDADALTVISRWKNKDALPPSWIMTPHSGELSRLLKARGCDVSSQEIDRDRFHFAQEAARLYGCIVLLKGYRTVVATNVPKNYVILAGNSALAKAGTGDVLAGMIGGLLAQGLKPVEAAVLGSYLHGRLADEWIKSGRDRLTLMASDIREILPALMLRLRQGIEP